MRPFTKMHGLGNDFVVFDATESPLTLSTQQARHIADRHLGIGCDQILIVEPPSSSTVDFNYRILNADGSESGQCGNGARCFAQFVRDQGLSSNDQLRVQTISGEMELHFVGEQLIRVNMGIPRFSPQAIPLAAHVESPSYEAILDNGERLSFHAVSMGNPHAVLDVADVETAHVESLGPALESHEIFPERANIGFSQLVNEREIRLRVYERGVGETKACGSGACAAMAVAHQLERVSDSVTVHLRGGSLIIDWVGGNSPLWMTGPAVSVFSGVMEL